MSVTDFLASAREDEDPAARAARQARQAAQRDDRAGELAEAERAAAAEDTRERLVLARQQTGIGIPTAGDIFSNAARVQAEDEAYEAARATIEKIDRRRAARIEAMRFEAQQLATVQRAVSDDPYDAARQRAHRAFAEATRAQLADAVTGTPRQARRPFGGVARRSEVTCAECSKVGATPEEAFAIHHPELLPPFEEMQDQIEQAERRQYSGRAEISR